MTALYDDRRRTRRWQSKLCIPMTCHLGVAPDGSLHLLKEFSQSAQTIRPKTIRGHRKKHAAIVYHSKWAFPYWLADDRHDDPNAGSIWKKQTPQERAVGFFMMAYKTYTDSVNDILINVSHGDVNACFGIGLKRAPYFFADRDVTAITPSGSKKKIFHAVRQHDRQIGDGRTVSVKAHYRGLRRFDWNGHAVRITWPGVNNSILLDGSAPGLADRDAVENYDPREWADAKRYGAVLQGLLDK